MLAFERQMAPRTPTGATRAPFQRSETPFPTPPPLAGAEPPPPAAGQPAGPPPMPPMPHVPENAGILHGIKFIFEALWWALTAVWMLFNRLPKWGRVVVSIWLVLTLFSIRCSNVRTNVAERPRSGEARPPPPNRPPADTQKKMRGLVERVTQSAREGKFNGDPEEISRLVGDLARGFADGFNETAAAGKSLVVVPFGPPTAIDSGDKFAHAVFVSLYGRIALERRTDVGVSGASKAELNDAAILARGRRLNALFVLAASPSPRPPYTLFARLFKVEDGTVVWTETYPVDDNDATAVAEQIHDKIFEHVPKKERDPRKEAGKEKARPPPTEPAPK